MICLCTYWFWNSYGVVTSLYNVIWSYIGYSNANYALSETKNPVKTLKIAAPAALGIVAVLYMLANVSNIIDKFWLRLYWPVSLTRLHTSPPYQRKRLSTPDVSWLLRSSETCLEHELSAYYLYSLRSQHLEMYWVLFSLRVEVSCPSIKSFILSQAHTNLHSRARNWPGRHLAILIPVG